jgi:hypothetical protein
MVVDRYARHDELPLRVVVGAATEEMACAAPGNGFWLGPAKRPKRVAVGFAQSAATLVPEAGSLRSSARSLSLGGPPCSVLWRVGQIPNLGPSAQRSPGPVSGGFCLGVSIHQSWDFRSPSLW